MKHLDKWSLVAAALLTVAIMGIGVLGTQPQVREVPTQPERDLSGLIAIETVLDTWNVVKEYHIHEDIRGQVLAISGELQFTWDQPGRQMVKYYRLPNSGCASSSEVLLFNALQRAGRGSEERILVWVNEGVISGLQTHGGEGANGCQ